MDEEDLGDYMAGSNLVKKGEIMVQEGAISELQIIPKQSIGYQIMRNMGWNERAFKDLDYPSSDESGGEFVYDSETETYC